MKKTIISTLLFTLTFCVLSAEAPKQQTPPPPPPTEQVPNPLNEKGQFQADMQNTNAGANTEAESGNYYQEEETEEEAISNLQPSDLRIRQDSFFSKSHKRNSNTLRIDYREGEIYKIRLRSAMVTSFILGGNETINSFFIGDTLGFTARILQDDPKDKSNVLLVSPAGDYVGLDTNLTIFTNSGKIIQLYIFSTDFTSQKNPHLTIMIQTNNYYTPFEEGGVEEKTKKTNPKRKKTNPQSKEADPKNKETDLKSKEAKTQSKEAERKSKEQKFYAVKAKQKQEKSKEQSIEEAKQRNREIKSIDYKARVEDDGEFIKIGDETNHLYIEKKKIVRGYEQKPRQVGVWYSFGIPAVDSVPAKALMAIEIFNDDDFTYFKYKRDDAFSKFPAVYKVVDRYDNPVNSKVVGDYLVAEDVSDQWTLRLGDEYVCVRKIKDPKKLKKFEEARQEAIKKAQEEKAKKGAKK